MLLALQFPNFDPVLIQIGPFAIRWYALAYIVGILLGWLYARALIRAERLWGGPAPMTALDFDDFILWVTLGIILGGRIGYVLFYNPAYFAAHPLEVLELWKGGMSFHGGFIGCVAAVVLFALKRGIPILSLGDVTCAVGTDRAVPRPPRQLHQRRIVGPRRPTCRGRWCFRAAGRCRAIRASSTRRRSKASCCSSCSALLIRGGALKRPGFDHRRLRGRLRARALVLRIVPRARPAARLPVGRADHGHAAVGAADAGRRRADRCRAAAPAAAARKPAR